MTSNSQPVCATADCDGLATHRAAIYDGHPSGTAKWAFYCAECTGALLRAGLEVRRLPGAAADDLNDAIDTLGDRLRTAEAERDAERFTLAQAEAGLADYDAEVVRLREALEEYADHQSWRCAHPDRYPWEPDCPCGLVSTLSGLGISAASDETMAIHRNLARHADAVLAEEATERLNRAVSDAIGLASQQPREDG